VNVKGSKSRFIQPSQVLQMCTLFSSSYNVHYPILVAQAVDVLLYDQERAAGGSIRALPSNQGSNGYMAPTSHYIRLVV
jgi:hypothetical protein